MNLILEFDKRPLAAAHLPMSLFRLHLSLWLLLLLTLASTWGIAAPASVVTTPQVRAELVAHAPDGVVAGKPLTLGLKIEHRAIAAA